MGKAKPKLSQVLIPVAFAFSCFGLLLFLWSSFGGPVPFGRPVGALPADARVEPGGLEQVLDLSRVAALLEDPALMSTYLGV